MARHEVIQVLDLAGSRVIGPMAPLSSQGLLPSLQVLIANIEYLLHFLEPPTAFPRLKSVVVVFEARYAFGNVTCNYNAFEPVLRFIAKRSGEMSLTLRLQSGMGFQTWLHGSSLEALGEVSNVVELFAYFCRPFDEGWADMQDFAPVSKLFPSLRKMKFA
ncbi:hypothetical protein H0H87_002272 [Tephrocybe sp. NHM501043]|nr:hypothetical protein H0H87_002272 [Tephrocybe sp. NHM501043]